MSDDQSLGNSRGAGTVTLQHIGTRDGHLAGSRLMLLLSALVGGALTWFLLQNIYPIFDIPEELLERTKGARDSSSRTASGVQGGLSAGGFESRHRRVGDSWSAAGEPVGCRGGDRATIVADSCLGRGTRHPRGWNPRRFGRSRGIPVGQLPGVVRRAVQVGQDVVRTRRVVGWAGCGGRPGICALTRRTSATLTCLAYGLLGGGLAALIWPVCAALVLPTMDPDCTFPSQGSVRLLWIAVVSVAFGLLIPEALRPRVPQRAPNASADA